jgi:hypothetical protein
MSLFIQFNIEHTSLVMAFPGSVVATDAALVVTTSVALSILEKLQDPAETQQNGEISCRDETLLVFIHV